jgi:hypothetical protein
MKNIHIIDKKTGRLAATIPVQLQGMNYAPTEQEYVAEAWGCAVSDGTVDPKRKDDYSFKLVEAPLHL